MRSHQASHYGQTSDSKYDIFSRQARWWVSQFAYLLNELKRRPDGNGTMLDTSVVLLCSEVQDGNTHSHQDMPFILAGGAGGMLKTGRFVDYGGRRHGDLLYTIAHAMGSNVTCWGDACGGLLGNILNS